MEHNAVVSFRVKDRAIVKSLNIRVVHIDIAITQRSGGRGNQIITVFRVGVHNGNTSADSLCRRIVDGANGNTVLKLNTANGAAICDHILLDDTNATWLENIHFSLLRIRRLY